MEIVGIGVWWLSLTLIRN